MMTVLARETIQKEYAQQDKQVWETQLALVDLKRSFPSLGDNGDEELLVDQEKSLIHVAWDITRTITPREHVRILYFPVMEI